MIRVLDDAANDACFVDEGGAAFLATRNDEAGAAWLLERHRTGIVEASREQRAELSEGGLSQDCRGWHASLPSSSSSSPPRHRITVDIHVKVSQDDRQRASRAPGGRHRRHLDARRAFLIISIQTHQVPKAHPRRRPLALHCCRLRQALRGEARREEARARGA